MAKKAIWHKGAKSHVVLILNVPVMLRPVVTRTPYVGCVSSPAIMCRTVHTSFLAQMWSPPAILHLRTRDVARQNRPASPPAVPHVESRQRKRKADGDHSRSATPDDIPEGDPNGSLERSPDGRGKVRQREKRVREDRHNRKDGDQDDRHRDLDDHEDHHHREG